MTALHNQMYQTAQAGDEAAFLEQREEVIRLFLITYIQVGGSLDKAQSGALNRMHMGLNNPVALLLQHPNQARLRLRFSNKAVLSAPRCVG